MFKRSAVPLSILLLMAVVQVIRYSSGVLSGLFPGDRSYVRIGCLRDGSPVYVQSMWTRSDYSLYDPQGRTIKKTRVPGEITADLMVMLDWYRSGLPALPIDRSGVLSVGPSREKELWYFMRREGRLEGYGQESSRQVGYMTPAGFSSERPDAQPRFAELRAWVDAHYARIPKGWVREQTEKEDPRLWLLAGSDVFLVDTQTHTVRKLASLPDKPQWIGLYEDHTKQKGDAPLRPRDQFIFAVTGARILKLSTQGDLIQSFPVPEEVRGDLKGKEWVQLSIGALDGGGTLIAARASARRQDLTHIIAFDSNGRQVRSHVLPSWPPWLGEPRDAAGDGAIKDVGEAAAGMPWMWGFGLAFEQAGPWMTLKNGLSLTCAILAACLIGFGCRNRPLSRPTRLFWIVFGFLFALPGLVVYLVVGPRGPMTACPSCGRKRPLDKQECPWCNAPFPAPAPTGLEIFSRE